MYYIVSPHQLGTWEEERKRKNVLYIGVRICSLRKHLTLKFCILFFFFLFTFILFYCIFFSSLVWTITEHRWLQELDLQSGEVGDLPKKSVILIYCNNYFNQLCWFFCQVFILPYLLPGMPWNVKKSRWFCWRKDCPVVKRSV